MYVSWQGCNRLMFFEMEDVIAGSATREQQGGSAEQEHECSLPDRDWTMPYSVTCACLMSAEMLLFVGLDDGSTVIWDCHLMTQVRACSMFDADPHITLLVKYGTSARGKSSARVPIRLPLLH